MRVFLNCAATAALMLAGCTRDPGFVPVRGVDEITAAQAASCAYLVDIRMKPGVYGPLADQGVKYARNSILADAKAAGGNAVVFKPVSPGTDLTLVEATAYRCPA
jgi:hypothetical protein